MEQMKVVHEASQVAYNASTALQTNVKVSSFPTGLLNNDRCHCCFAVHMVLLDESFGTYYVHLSWVYVSHPITHWVFDTSPTYLLFQTLLPLFWTLTGMI